MDWMANYINEWTGMRYEDLVRLAQDREQRRILRAHLLEEDRLTALDDDCCALIFTNLIYSINHSIDPFSVKFSQKLCVSKHMLEFNFTFTIESPSIAGGVSVDGHYKVLTVSRFN